MALESKSLFTYGIQVTALNNKIDFKAASGGLTLTATLNLGFYSPASLAQEIAFEMQSVDTLGNIYSVSVNRTVMGGTQNRVIISTNGTFLSLLFGTGPNFNISASAIMGFNPSDYTGSTTYIGSFTTGSTLIPEFIGYNYLDNTNQSKIFGAVNVSASGLKEAVTFNTQFFVNVEYKYEPKANLAAWKSFFLWSIQQRPFDFTPEIANPTNVLTVTLDSTQYEDQGLGYQMSEMLASQMPNFYETGPLKFRLIVNLTSFSGG